MLASLLTYDNSNDGNFLSFIINCVTFSAVIAIFLGSKHVQFPKSLCS
jgi:hypothetical protein